MIMKYLKKVTLKNFQSHKESALEFNEGLNVIVGPSDSGKSAIIRGIKWALYNEPSGNYFIREGETECSVTLEFSDNTKVKRLRTKSKNTYILYDKEGKEFIFEGFGTGVPQEIIDQIGIKKIYLDSTDSSAINIGEQLEGAFLLSNKTSTRASAIGRLIGVNVIDDALKNTLRDLRNASISKKNLDEKILKLEKEIEEYAYLDNLSLRLKELETMESLINKLNIKKEHLINISSEYKEIKHEIEIITSELDNLKHIEILEKILKKADILCKELKHFILRKNNLVRLKDEINNSISIINDLKDIAKVKNIYNILLDITNKKTYLLKLECQINDCTKSIAVFTLMNSKLATLSNVYKKIDKVELENSRLKDLKNIKEKFNANQKSLEIGKKYIERFDKIDTVNIICDKLENTLHSLKRFNILSDNIRIVKNKYIEELATFDKASVVIDSNLNKYKELLKKQGVCPFCLSHIDDNKISHIIGYYLEEE